MEHTPEPIADILDRRPSETSEPSPQETKTETPATETGLSRDDKGRFAPKTETKAETVPQATGVKAETVPPPVTAPSQPPPGHVPIAALVDTRLEARLAKQERDELRRQLAELQKPKAEPVDFYTDPDAALNQRLTPFQEKFDRTVSSLTLRASKAEAIAVHGKSAVAEMEDAIGQMMEAGDPEVAQLRQQMLNSEDPVGVAMSWHQRKKVFAEVGDDPVAYREKLKAELLAELNGAAEQQPKPAPNLLPNLAGARNVGTRSGPTWTGPTPLADIFKR